MSKHGDLSLILRQTSTLFMKRDAGQCNGTLGQEFLIDTMELKHVLLVNGFYSLSEFEDSLDLYMVNSICTIAKQYNLAMSLTYCH